MIKLPEIVGSSSAMQNVFRSIGRLSTSDMTVLLTGESGTGKELVARPFIDIAQERTRS